MNSEDINHIAKCASQLIQIRDNLSSYAYTRELHSVELARSIRLIQISSEILTEIYTVNTGYKYNSKIVEGGNHG